MKKTAWKKQIMEQAKAVGTYQEAFERLIETLATILEQRDTAYEDFVRSGGETVVEKVSDRGAVNMVKNPRLAVWMDLNTQALAYWRDLGLTPAGLKRIDEKAIKTEKPKKGLEDILAGLGV